MPSKALNTLQQGAWLGVDVGSARAKVCSFCRIDSDGKGHVGVAFEQGAAEDPYPRTNTGRDLIEASRRPTYLKDEVEAAVREVLDRSRLVADWLERSRDLPSAVAVDAPVAFAVEGRSRLTEQQSTDTFTTPTRADFEAQLRVMGDPFLRVNVFWKCVGLAVYRHLAARIESGLASAELETLAARTCAKDPAMQRLRETFPSDVYKRANGYEGRDGTPGILGSQARDVLRALVEAEWQGAGEGRGRRPASRTLDRLRTIRRSLHSELESGVDALREIGKRPGRVGDLFDAFGCAFAACSEDHGAAELHGWSDDPDERARLRAEGAILTVRRRAR